MIKVKYDSQYVSYLIDDHTKYSITGHRVLKKQKGKGFLPCYKTSYNGQIKLMYPVEAYDSLFFAAEDWGTRDVYEWILRILKSLLEVRDSGFLRIEDVDLSRIFVDIEKRKVHLIVLPLTSDASISENKHWEQELEKSIISLMEVSKMRSRQDIADIKAALREEGDSLESLYLRVKKIAASLEIYMDTGKLENNSSGELKKKEIQEGELHLICCESSDKTDIAITKDSFILGKNPKLSDGVLSMSPTISRQHCRITRDESGYFIEDLGSLNHTFVNGIMVEKGKKVLITPGMKIHLANVEFKLELRN